VIERETAQTRRMIVAIVVPGVVQALILWATLKYLGIALDSLVLMRDIRQRHRGHLRTSRWLSFF
jgi:hypothetical protein